MKTRAPKPQPLLLEREHFERELTEAKAIYQRLFDDRKLSLFLNEGRDPRYAHPHVHEGEQTFQPEVFRAAFLGKMSFPDPYEHAPKASVSLDIPPPPTKGELAFDGDNWAPAGRIKWIYRASPLLYEKIRYAVEMRRWKKSSERHSWRSLAYCPGLLPVEERPASDQRPAVLVGFHWLEVGGAEKLAFDTVNWALEAGLRVIVVASVPALQRLADRLPDHPDVQFIRVDRFLPHHLWPRFLVKLIEQENIRLIHIHHCTPIYAALAHIRATIPQITVIDSTHIVEYNDGGFPRISGVWTNYIDFQHVISNQLKTFFDTRFHHRDKVLLGRMLTRSEEEITLPPVTMEEGKKVLNIAYIGRYQYQKRPLVVVYTVKTLVKWARKNGVDLRVKMVGEGVMRPATEALVRRLGLQGVIEFLPANVDVPALMDASDILLLPSNNEGLALVCYEAIQHGCIPVSTDVGGQAEIIPPELMVGLEPTASIRDSAAAVERLWRDGDFIMKMQEALHRRYRQLAADPTAKEVLMPIYQAVAEGMEPSL